MPRIDRHTTDADRVVVAAQSSTLPFGLPWSLPERGGGPFLLTHRTYHATPCNKKWQAVIELPKRPGVQCGGQAGVSRRRGDGSKAPSSARTARPHLGVRCSSGLGAPASTARRLRVGWSPTSPPITDELTSVLAFHGQHAFALGTIIASAESWPDLGRRWPSRLVATAAEDRLIFRRKAHVVLRQPAMRCCNVALIRPQHLQRPRSITRSAFSPGRRGAGGKAALFWTIDHFVMAPFSRNRGAGLEAMSRDLDIAGLVGQVLVAAINKDMIHKILR
jgi:hypothetical protein